ncbi:hypothetical protein BUALT_Bualt03G0138900 [Buddleja alternifolia]|uniref:Uncharacterized protein n=1 Tax=Buddleja alternifolia TaxID=168488 RepID=A0AAV6Y1Z1_9LAMI|nr:hypothetical protein BUALT_Bualt03G0138900 [Buddleja alternifolia]
MENPRRKHSSSGDKFSFPITIKHSDQFEFGCVTTPGSPNSPADHLFFNGKLLPHVFPTQTTSHNFSCSRSTSRTSSISSSKDSLMSSRSNSTNSRSSNCSSARTSTSDQASERKTASFDGNIPARTSVRKERNRPGLGSQYQYGSSQRWQLMAAAPVLKHQGSRSRKIDHVLDRKGSKKSSGVDIDENCNDGKLWFGKRILKSFVSACKECHAIETSNVDTVSPRSLEM